MRELIPTEEQEQAVLCDWLRLHNIVFHHSPNEGKHAVQYRVKQARLGVSKGFPDILIFDIPGILVTDECTTVTKDAFLCSGIAIELKRRKGGKASPEQKQWLADLERRGWVTHLCHGADEAIEWLESLGFGRRSA
jgi:hypothetical protein